MIKTHWKRKKKRHRSNFYLIKWSKREKAKCVISFSCFSFYDASRRLCRTHRSIRKVNTYHICMYWTLMSKVIHDLFWHSSISFWWWLHRCTILYVNILWYTNNTHTHTCPVIRFRYVCPPHMHTNEENEIIFNYDNNIEEEEKRKKQ